MLSTHPFPLIWQESIQPKTVMLTVACFGMLCCAVLAAFVGPAGPMPDLLQRVITADSPTGQKVTGEVIHYDGLMHTGRGCTQRFNATKQCALITHSACHRCV
jgi:hypothetical protein